MLKLFITGRYVSIGIGQHLIAAEHIVLWIAEYAFHWLFEEDRGGERILCNHGIRWTTLVRTCCSQKVNLFLSEIIFRFFLQCIDHSQLGLISRWAPSIVSPSAHAANIRAPFIFTMQMEVTLWTKQMEIQRQSSERWQCANPIVCGNFLICYVSLIIPLRSACL